MEQLFNYLSLLVGNPEENQGLITVVVALLIFVAIISVMLFITGSINPIQKRLKKLGEHEHTVDEERQEQSERLKKLRDSVQKVSPAMMPRNSEELSKIRAKLQQAGFRSQNAVFFFFALKTLLAIFLPLMVFVISPLFSDMKAESVVYLAVGAMGLGVFFPNAAVDRMVAMRQEKIQKGFADFLDLLVVCVEAGLSLDIAIRRVSKELTASHAVLAQELTIVSGEINAGIERLQALKNFSDRVGLDDIKGFVALLAQSIRFGTSMADTLRIYSADFRDKRMQRAEEKAAKVGTKLIFPMVLCFFPVFFVVAIGPVLLQVFKVFGR